MAKSFTGFLGQMGKVVPSRQPGQSQDDDSKERDRKFSAQAVAIEKLKQARLSSAPEVVTKAVRKKAKPAH